LTFQRARLVFLCHVVRGSTLGEQHCESGAADILSSHAYLIYLFKTLFRKGVIDNSVKKVYAVQRIIGMRSVLVAVMSLVCLL